MKNKNLWILAALVALIALVAVLGAVVGGSPVTGGGAPSLPRGISITSPSGQEIAPDAQPAQAQAYLRVTVRGAAYPPLPLTQEGDYTITQQETGNQNVVHVTQRSIAMKSATCDNQDCVHQGIVTPDNMDGRVLGNMIICLPNQVTLELYTPDQLYGQFVQPGEEDK